MLLTGPKFSTTMQVEKKYMLQDHYLYRGCFLQNGRPGDEAGNSIQNIAALTPLIMWLIRAVLPSKPGMYVRDGTSRCSVLAMPAFTYCPGVPRALVWKSDQQSQRRLAQASLRPAPGTNKHSFLHLSSSVHSDHPNDLPL